MMWLSLYLPQLSLESLPNLSNANWLDQELKNSNISDTLKPVAVIENKKIICINPAAKKQGVKLQQKMSTAYALCDDIQLLERSVTQEKQTLTNLA